MISIFIVEDDEVTRTSLCERISQDAGFCVTHAVGTCNDIRALLQNEAPDVLLVDLGLPDGSGIDVIAEAVTRYPKLNVMVITVFGDERRVVGAIRAGAAGYLLKDDHASELVAAIHQLNDGGSPISPAIARHLIRVFRTETGAEDEGVQPLSAREQEVLSLAAKGFSYAEIAKVIGLSSNTVASYTKNIYKKLSVSSRAQAIYEASRLGLLNKS